MVKIDFLLPTKAFSYGKKKALRLDYLILIVTKFSIVVMLVVIEVFKQANTSLNVK